MQFLIFIMVYGLVGYIIVGDLSRCDNIELRNTVSKHRRTSMILWPILLAKYIIDEISSSTINYKK